MKIEELRPSPGSKRKPKRVGRGVGSGHGKTSCRGHKGQKSRSGGGKSRGFEGGQMPLQRRLPKRGFRSPFPLEYTVLNLKDVDRLGLDSVSPEVLLERKVISSLPLKILGGGDLKRAVSIKAHAFSAAALKKIEGSGGKAEVV